MVIEEIKRKLNYIIDQYIASLTINFPDSLFRPQHWLDHFRRNQAFSFLRLYLEQGSEFALSLHLCDPDRVGNILVERDLEISGGEYNLMLRRLREVSKSLVHYVNINILELPSEYIEDIKRFLQSEPPLAKVIKKGESEVCDSESKNFLIQFTNSHIEDVKRILEWCQQNNIPNRIDSQVILSSRESISKIQKHPNIISRSPESIMFYCIIHTHNEAAVNTKKDYERLMDSIHVYDLFIDGFTRQVWHKKGKISIGPVELTPFEYTLLKEYVIARRPMRPIMAIKKLTNSPESAQQIFKTAREKADVKIDNQKWLFFRSHKTIEAESKAYEFSPPQDFKYCLIEPIIS